MLEWVAISFSRETFWPRDQTCASILHWEAEFFCHLGHEKYSNNKKEIFNLTMQYPEKYSTTVQELAYWGWHQVNRQEELVTGGGRGGGGWQSWRIDSNRGQRSCSFTHTWSCLHLWKFATRRLACRGLAMFILHCCRTFPSSLS